MIGDVAIIKRGGTGSVKLKKLWENASPASDFAAQTVTVNLSKYTWILIVFGGYRQRNTAFTIAKVGGSAALALGHDDDDFGRRAYTAAQNGVTVGAGYYAQGGGAWVANEGHCAPLYFYGIEGMD